MSRELGSLLATIGERIRDHLSVNRDLTSDSKAVGHEGGDTIFAIDRKVEPIVASVVESWPDEMKPILAIAEGFGRDGKRWFGSPNSQPRYRMLIDPIDGTRNLMYDKRSAWFLAAIAPDQGEDTRLSHTLASVMVELPPSKQLMADSFIYCKGYTVEGKRTRIDNGSADDLTVGPSRETTLLHGFGQVSNFFPGTKQLAAELMERIAEGTLGHVQPGQATIFDDQYISTGGQLVELVVGHDRFCCDLRPIFYDILERRSGRPVARGLECHPYDMAGMALAKAAGVILTDGFGDRLDALFNVFDAVHWCGYANDTLRRKIEPIIQSWIYEQLGR
jgi:hypothetical protein